MTWRDAIATFRAYSDVGAYELKALRDAAMAGMAIKVLFWPAMPIWVAVVLSLPTLGVYCVYGYIHKRWGWMQEASTVQVRQEMSRAANVQWEWQARMLEKLGCGLEVGPNLSAKVQSVLAVPDRNGGGK